MQIHRGDTPETSLAIGVFEHLLDSVRKPNLVLVEPHPKDLGTTRVDAGSPIR